MYITAEELIKKDLEYRSPKELGEILSEIITEFKKSDERQEMIDGEEYYKVNNTDISEFERTWYDSERYRFYKDNLAANNRIKHGFHYLNTEQKKAYILGQKPTFSSDDAGLDEQLELFRTDAFWDFLERSIVTASNKGREIWQIHIKNGFKIKRIDPKEIILVYDTHFQESLTHVIRYYTVAVDDGAKKQDRLNVELWDGQTVIYFIEDTEGSLIKTNEVNHFEQSIDNTEFKEGKSWGYPPFVVFSNNPLEFSDLHFIKSLIDAYDFNVSDLSNTLEDLADAIWKVIGADADDPIKVRRNLKNNRLILVPEGGSAEKDTMEIPIKARDSHLDRLKKDIVKFSQSMDWDTEKFGQNPSGVALKYMSMPLDLKARATIKQLKFALGKLFWFYTEYLKIITNKRYDPEKIKSEFHITQLINETETIGNLNKSYGKIPNETYYEKHPYINDPDEAQKLVEKQKEKRQKEMTDFMMDEGSEQ